MPRHAFCPAELQDRVFRGSTVVTDGLLTPGQLRSRIWVRLSADLYVHRDHRDEPRTVLEAVRLITREGLVACGRTSAWLQRVWSPPPGVSVPLEFTRPGDRSGREVQGQSRRRLTLRESEALGVPDVDITTRDGVAMTSGQRTCFDLMRERRLVEAVVVADAFLFAGEVNATELAVYIGERSRWPGVAQARLALGLANPFSRSPGESRLRVLLVLSGFEEPLVNVPVVDAAGRTVAVPDLQVRGRRWVWLEYDGGYHRDGDQHVRDLRRENRLAVVSGGVPVLRFDKDHLGTAAARERAVWEVARSAGVPRVIPLDHRDFWRPAPPRSW